MKKVLVLLVILSLASCSQKDDVRESAQDVQSKKVPVRVATVTTQPVIETITLYGETTPLWTLDIFPDGAGKVIEKNFTIGNKVNKGDVLAKIIQDIPGMEFSPSPIESPATGVVTACMIEIGSKVNPQMPVYKIAGLDSLKIMANVLETQIARLHPGMPCKVKLPGNSTEKSLAINRIWPMVDARSKTGRIECILPNKNNSYRPGLTAECTFTFTGTPSLFVPLDAIIRNGMRTAVYKIEMNSAKLVSVACGDIQSGKIAIKGALSEGDSVVVYGQNMLREGDKINVIENEHLLD